MVMFVNSKVYEAWELVNAAHDDMMRVEELLIAETTQLSTESVLAGLIVDNLGELLDKLKEPGLMGK